MKQTVELSHLGGHELLRDGTQEDGTFECVDDLREYLENDHEMETHDNEDNLDLHAYTERYIESAWNDMYNDGGGWGAIDYSETEDILTIDDIYSKYLENNKQDEFVLHGIEFAYNTLKAHYES